MRIQPISTNQQQPSFQKFKPRKLKTVSLVNSIKSGRFQKYERDMFQEIRDVIARCAATITTYFVRHCQSRYPQVAKAVVPAVKDKPGNAVNLFYIA